MKRKNISSGKSKKEAFDEIKRQLQKYPVLYIPNNRGRFHLDSDTGMFATGSALYQNQNRQQRLITCASKRIPTAAQNYSKINLELCGLAINIVSFSLLLYVVDFNAVGGHLALTLSYQYVRILFLHICI